MMDILLFLCVLPIAACGVATIILLGILLTFLIKSFKEEW